jgi:uncharacterized protein YegP (UPF0339 family)
MAGKNRIIIKESKDNQKYIVVKSANNKIIVNSETYKTKQSAEKSVKALEKVIKNAKVVDQTKKINKNCC